MLSLKSTFKSLVELNPHEFHANLAKYNKSRMSVGIPLSNWEEVENANLKFRILEGRYIEGLRSAIQPWINGHEGSADHFSEWFASMLDWAPGQHHPLFNWLAEEANLEEMKWFLTQEAAGEAGFEDLVACTQVKLPVQVKLECARNYWDEMGRGKAGAMHGPLLERMIYGLGLKPTIETTVWESLALGNLMLGLANTRRYTYQALGALGAIELTAPLRAAKVAQGMKRLGLSQKISGYFDLHAVLDVLHSQTWISEIVHPLVSSNSESAKFMAEGALMRLKCGHQCFDRYCDELGLNFESKNSVF
ncbi:MAG: iron-containing redox enzyme family protein [Pseudomonadota bacterium]